MAKVVKLILPMPPSANRYWRNYRGVTVVSDEARRYKSAVWHLAQNQRARVFQSDVAVKIDVYRERKSGDLDNRLKIVLDALKGLAYSDDKQIVEIHARRFDDKANPRIEVEVKAA